MNYQTFTDESGDPGTDIDRGASKYFVMSTAIFKDALEIQILSAEIKKLARKLFKNDFHEFHFVNERPEHRHEFMKLISKHKFEIVIFQTDKTIHKTSNNLYELALKNICSHITGGHNSYTMKFDGKVSKSYKFAVEKSLRTFSKQKFVIDKIKFVNSKGDSMIQLADMVAGIIRRKLEHNDTLTIESFNLIKDKIII